MSDASYLRALDCVHCGLCLSACPTYDVLGLETDSPRGRIYLMRALAEGRIDDFDAVRVHLDRCLDCRACETVCPSGVEYGRLLESVRSEQPPAPGMAARLRRWLLRRVVAHQGRLRLAFRFARAAQVLGLPWLAGKLRLLPRGMIFLRSHVPAGRERRPLYGTWKPDGPTRGRVSLFTGCVMEQLFGDVNRKTLQLLLANGFEVDVPRAQACCGALLVHDGQADVARELAARNLDAFAGADIIVNNSAGCGAALKEYGHLLDTAAARAFAARCRDICELLGERGLTATPAPFPHTVAYEDPCHLCHAQGVRQQPRRLLTQVPELQLVQTATPESCCGSAGIYNMVQPDTAHAIGASKARAVAATGADCVATGNPGCMMQLSAHLRALGSKQRVVHPVELLLPAGHACAGSPTLGGSR